MTVDYVPSRIDGVGQLLTPFRQDARGGFSKVYGEAVLEALDVDFTIREVYWSRSSAGVIRGLHFQTPPSTIGKIVFVNSGTIRDIIVDLRPGSATYGEHVEFTLDESSGAVFVPHGCAHGFEVVEGPALTCYLQDGPFDPTTDSGIRWDSVPINWHTTDPVVSDRDRLLPAFDPESSPFACGTVDE